MCSTLRFMGDFTRPKPRMYDMALEIRYMGQDLMNPPTVEGWHTGKEWIDSGTLVERVNYAASEMGRIDAPGIKAVVRRFSDAGPIVSAGDLLDGCLEMLGGYQLMDETRNLFMTYLENEENIATGGAEFAQQVGQMLQLIVSTQEYQFT